MSASSLMNTTGNISLESQTKSPAGLLSAPILKVVTANIRARVSDMPADRAMRIYGKYDSIKMKRVCFDTDPSVGTNTTKYWFVWQGANYNITSVQNGGGGMNRVWFADVINKPF